MDTLATSYSLLGPSRHVCHTTACRSPALTFSAAITFALKRSAPCSALLCHFLSSSAAVFHWSALIPKGPRSSRRHSNHLFLTPHSAHAPHQLSGHPAFRTWLISYGEPTSIGTLTLRHSLLGPSRYVCHTTACRSPALTFSAAINFALERSAPYSAVLCHLPSSSAAVVHWSALIPKAPRSFRRHPIHYFSCPPTQPAPPFSSPNIPHLRSLVSSMRSTNPTNRILLVHTITSMLSLPILRRRVSRWEIGWSVLSSCDSITVSSTWELTSVSMRYSQGNGVNTSLSRITYCTHVVYTRPCLTLFCVPFLYVCGYLPWHDHVLPRAPVIKIMCGNHLYLQG